MNGSTEDRIDLDAGAKAFVAEHDVLAVYLFGSALSGRMRSDSDIDLAVMPEPGRRIDPVRLLDLATKAAIALGREVDTGELSSRNLVYARQAILTGRRIFARDVSRADLAAACLLGLYARFHEERREVLDAYTA